MSDRYYHHGCPQNIWDEGIKYLPPEMKKIALQCVGEPDSYLMSHSPREDWRIPKEGWVYFTTRKLSEKLERIVHKYLETLAWESYGAY